MTIELRVVRKYPEVGGMRTTFPTYKHARFAAQAALFGAGSVDNHKWPKRLRDEVMIESRSLSIHIRKLTV